MHTYRITCRTQCGKTDVIVENGNCYAEAWQKAKQHVFQKHSPMQVLKAEVKDGSSWIRV